MKTKRLLIPLGLVILAFVAGRFTVKSAGEDPRGANGDAAGLAAQATAWTCSMHPQIRQPSQGDCPICGMDLIPLTRGDDDPGPRAMRMSPSAMALADIETAVVERMPVERETRLVGRLYVDETRERSLTARFPARVEELFVNFEGVVVNQGDHLALVYSPELFAAQSELLTAYRHDPAGVIARAAREKLRLWDLLPGQIDQIIQRNSARERVELKAPIGGVVMRKHIKEGDYLQTGEVLFQIADLDALWLLMEAYESDLPWLRYGQTVSFSVEAFPGESFAGTIAFIAPEVDRTTRTVQVRVNVPNPDGRLKPGMFARGVVRTMLAADGRVRDPDLAGKWISPMHPEVVKDAPGVCDVCGMDLVPAAALGYVDAENSEAPLVVPASAVLRTGKRAVVYTRLPDDDAPVFEGREVTLGARAGDRFIVLEGLAEGEVVVSHGAFKIDSAMQIVAKPSMMNPEPDAPAAIRIELSGDLAKQLLPGYLALHAALAGDQFEPARAAVESMMELSGHQGEPGRLFHAMLNAKDLDGIRRPFFEQLSNAMIEAVQGHPSPDGVLYIMHCPMVYDDRGASWLQDEEELLNPYFGASMLYCGTTEEILGAGGHGDDHHER